MAYRYTVIDNLKYLDEVFHNIAHNIPHPNVIGYEGQDDANLVKWECVDDRFSTGFGSTYEVPINDFPTRDEQISITVFGDMWLHVDEVTYNDTWMESHEVNTSNTRKDRVLYKESLPEVLHRVYTNCTIALIGNFSHTATNEIDFDDVLGYLQGLSTYPDYFIFNGVSKTWSNYGTQNTIQKLKDIDNFCKTNKIRACCIFTENNLMSSISSKEWSEIFSTTTRMLKFSVLEWATHHLKIMDTNYNVRNNTTDLDSFFGNRDLTVDFNCLNKYITSDNLANGAECYEELVYTNIKRFVLTQLFILHRECFYVSLLYKSVHGGMDGTTYDYYFGTPDRDDNRYAVQKPYYNKIADFKPEENKKVTPDEKDKRRTFSTKYKQNGWNMFKNSGQFVAICLHTDFTEHLWAWQQGQSSCYEEFLNLREIRDGSNNVLKKNSANLMKIRTATSKVTQTGTESSENTNNDKRTSPPIFPGTGCSMFTISEDNRVMYKNIVNCECPIDIWVTRDRYTASITIRLRTKGNTATSYYTPPDLYQSIEFGKMSLRETDSYTYPLYCGGGSTGLSSDIYSYTPSVTSSSSGKVSKVTISGNVYDLSMDYIGLSNSNILHPTKFCGCAFSNFKVLTSEGVWRSIYAHEQTSSLVPYPSEVVSDAPDHALILNQPTNIGDSQDSAYPFLATNWNTTGTQHLINHEIYCREPVDYSIPISFYTKLDCIRIALNKNVGHGQYLSYGTIPCCWRAWDNELPSGEFIWDDKKYLVIPCGWDERLWAYNYHLGIINDIWEDDDIVDDFEKYYYGQNTKIKDKLVIELGDANV